MMNTVMGVENWLCKGCGRFNHSLCKHSLVGNSRLNEYVQACKQLLACKQLRATNERISSCFKPAGNVNICKEVYNYKEV